MKRYLIGALSLVLAACAQGTPTQPSTGIAGGAAGAPLAVKPSVPRNFRAHLSGREEVPARATRAQGQAVFQLSSDGSELSYRLIASNIENVVAAHIHRAPAGSNGPVVAALFLGGLPGGGRTNGVLATGIVTDADLVGPLDGMTLADLIADMETDGTYVNVHTNDGVPPTNEGPGDFPGGEIRGQIH